MSHEDDWAPGNVAAMIGNPFYAINFDEGLVVRTSPSHLRKLF